MEEQIRHSVVETKFLRPSFCLQQQREKVAAGRGSKKLHPDLPCCYTIKGRKNMAEHTHGE